MATTAEEVVVRLVADTKRYQEGMQAASKSADGVQDGVKKAQQATQTLGRVGAQGVLPLVNSFKQAAGVSTTLEQNLNHAAAATRTMGLAMGAASLAGGLLGTAIGMALGHVIRWATEAAASGREIKKMEDALRTLVSAVGAYEDALRNAGQASNDLYRKFGEGASRARELYQALAQLRQLEAMAALSEQAASVEKEFRGLESRLQIIDDMMRQDSGGEAVLARQARLLTKEFGLTVDQARGIKTALDNLSTATGPEDVSRAMQAVSTAILEAANNGAKIPPEIIKTAAEMAGVSLEALRLNGILNQTPAAMDAIANAASGITAELNRAIAAADRLRSAAIADQRRAQIELDYRTDPVARARALAAAQFDAQAGNAGMDARLFNTMRKEAMDAAEATAKLNLERERLNEIDRKEQAAAGSRKTSGGGAKSAVAAQPSLFAGSDMTITHLEREISIIGKSSAEIAKARAEWALYDEAKRQGIPITEAVNAQITRTADEVGRLTAELEAGQMQQQQFEAAIDGIADAFANAIVAGESLRKGLANVFAGIASDLIRSGIRDMLMNLIPGMGGGGVISSFLPGRATGGQVSAGRAYMVGERGPEPFIPAVNGRVLSTSQAKDALRGDQAGGVVRVIIEEAPGFAARVQTEAQGVALQVVAGYDKALPGRVQQISANPRYR